MSISGRLHGGLFMYTNKTEKLCLIKYPTLCTVFEGAQLRDRERTANTAQWCTCQWIWIFTATDIFYMTVGESRTRLLVEGCYVS